MDIRYERWVGTYWMRRPGRERAFLCLGVCSDSCCAVRAAAERVPGRWFRCGKWFLRDIRRSDRMKQVSEVQRVLLRYLSISHLPLSDSY